MYAYVQQEEPASMPLANQHHHHAIMSPSSLHSTLTAVCVLLLAVAAAAASEFDYPAAFNFGDSNSDTGNLIVGMGDELRLPNGETHFGRPAGRLCDGRLIIDFLMEAMELPPLNAYLDSLGAPNFGRGCNFAAAGSTVLPATVNAVCPFSFGIQVAQFMNFKARVLELLLEGDSKLKKVLPRQESFAQALYTFDVGQNDLADAFFSKSEDQVLASIPTILREFEKGIKKLYDQGARRFWIHNTGPLGCLPRYIYWFGKDPSKLDEHGCVASHNLAARFFNLQLHALCAKLQGDLTAANITYTDIFSIKSNLIANYSRYGFENPLMACCGLGGPPLNYSPQISCGQKKTINGSEVTAIGCDDPTKHINWDGIHYTEAANLHVTSQILTGKFSDPPFYDQMPFLLKMNF